MFDKLLREYTDLKPVAFKVLVKNTDTVFMQRVSECTEYTRNADKGDFAVFSLCDKIEQPDDIYEVPLFNGSIAHIYYAKSGICLSDLLNVDGGTAILMTDEQYAQMSNLKKTLRRLTPSLIAMLAIHESVEKLVVPSSDTCMSMDDTFDAIGSTYEFIEGVDPKKLFNVLSFLREWATTNTHQRDSNAANIQMIRQPVRVARHEIRNIDGEEERYVLAIVLEPNDGSDNAIIDPDANGNIYSNEEVRNACHWYAENGGKKGFMHGLEQYDGYLIEKDDQSVVLLENYVMPIDVPPCTIAPEQELIKKGTWMVGFRVNDDDIWGKVKSGEVSGVSVGMLALKQPLQ
jgi:hypothetical protein